MSATTPTAITTITAGKTLTLTGGDSGTKDWKCHEPITQSSGCPANYKVYNGSTEINTTKAPCWEDTIVVDSDDAVSIKWQPGHIVASVRIAGSWNSPSSTGTAVSEWPGNDEETFDEWSNAFSSQFAGTSPFIDPTTGSQALCSADVCPMFCLNTCPEADILDVNLFLQFGSNVTQDMIDDALDNAIVQRAALGRFRNDLHRELGPEADTVETLGYPDSFTGLLGDLGIGLSGNEMADRLTWMGNPNPMLFGWTATVNNDTGTISLGGRPGAKYADYNLAHTQLRFALVYLAGLDSRPEPVATPMSSMVQSDEVGFMDNVVATSGHAADWLEGDGINTQIGTVAMRMYIRNYLTNNRAQMTATWYSNETATGDVTASDWTADDNFNMTTSGGVVHDTERRALATAGFVDGGSMKDRAISAANAYLAAFSGVVPPIQIESAQQIRCGSEHFLESNIPYAHGACNFSQVSLSSSVAVVQTDPAFAVFTSLLGEPVIAAVLGMVTTQMSMHAVGSQLNESILRTDAAWAAFMMEDEEDAFPLMIIIIAAAAALVLCLIIAIVVLMGGKSEKQPKDNRNVVAFENPMYDDPTSGGGEGEGEGDPGLYDEPTFQEAGKANPTYDSNEDVAADGGGYLDVEPDDGDEDEDGDDDESDDDDE